MKLTPHDETMMLKTPFHSRCEAACEINMWEDWKGYTSAQAYTEVEKEYFAVRNATGVFDISPMMKYRITGPEAGEYLNRLVTRDMRKINVGRVAYAIWCDDDGKVMDDGTIFRLGENDYRLCAYARCLDWLMWTADGFNVDITDETADVAALAVQGPTSCTIFRNMGFEGLENLKPFGMTTFPFKESTVMISRTGFTGDLGYEIWIKPDLAESFWDALFEAGKLYGIQPIGGYALDMLRTEAGFLQAGVDFVPAEEAVRIGRSRSPFELGLGWLVSFDKPIFNGRRALLSEKNNGSEYAFVYLDVDGNKPAEHAFIYLDSKASKEVGTVTTAAWCPTAKSNVAFAQVDAKYGKLGQELVAEIYYERELKWTRVMAKCTVVKGPVFDPPRKRQTPAPAF